MPKFGNLAVLFTVVAMVPVAAQAQREALTNAPVAGPESHAAAFATAAVAETDLKAATGREDVGTSVASATQRNTVADNSVTGNSVTGAVTIDGNAFQNIQGMAVINANSGNNVAINSAMNVVINMAPKP